MSDRSQKKADSTVATADEWESETVDRGGPRADGGASSFAAAPSAPPTQKGSCTAT